MAESSVFDELVAANARYVEQGEHRVLPVAPARQLAIVTCMDARIDVFAMAGLALGDAHVLRNAGARVTEDVRRSLALSTHLLGTRSVALVAHTRCGVHDPEGTAYERMSQTMGRAPADRDWRTFTDPRRALRDDADVLLAWPDRPDGFVVGAYLFDVDTGRLEQVVAPTAAEPV
ncbi:beta-class carbonic anhydrase [Egicoccus halophilus]|uniref:carbonic anhydrase n=1 Tax=Egicoccus halophilus TaxID=1670830 RepID=A0A8J3A6M0_9ACTN|nr:carbonic anhydrase [Egicoccus halophilus]GGI04619.1 carbonic anhydrase [Egicoccus halophilus]